MHLRIVELLAAGCVITDLTGPAPTHRRLLGKVLPARWYPPQVAAEQRLRQGLSQLQPHLALVSQGGNLDGIDLADVCRQVGLPYVLLAQKAAEIFLTYDVGRALIRQVYEAARHCFFVSRHNLELTRRQLALFLPQASVVRNPVNVPLDAELPAPPLAAGRWLLACVARLDILDKGQDILLQVLARPHWRDQPLHVTFFGSGPHHQGLVEMADFLGLADQVSFAGHVPDVAAIWQTHHALVLPSRYEGLPLALAEAMLCGRPAIAADAGGVAELLLNDETGFLAAAATPDAFDEALGRAWARRAEWPALGRRAAAHARTLVPADAGADFAQLLLALAPAVPTVTSHALATAL
jgi:glycosyltransferase involved in cell wall biosynthesis